MTYKKPKEIYLDVKKYAFKLYQNDLFETFFEIARVFLEGRKKYKKNDWRDPKRINHHLEHIRKHLDNFEKNMDSLSTLDDLTHAATRCIMLAQAQIDTNKQGYIKNVSKYGLPRITEVDPDQFRM